MQKPSHLKNLLHKQVVNIIGYNSWFELCKRS